MDKLIQDARNLLAGLLTERQAATDSLAHLRDQLDDDTATVTEAAVAAAIAARDAFDPQIEAAQARLAELESEQARDNAAQTLATQYTPRETAAVHVGAEPDVYRKGGPVSYFRDLYRATVAGAVDAGDRLRRNNDQVRTANGIGTTDNAGGEFVPPLWIVEEYQELARAGRVIANRVRQESMPAGTDSISLPLVTGGTSTAKQTQGSALSETDMVTSSTTAAVITVGGVQTVNVQLVEQSPINIDSVVLGDLAASHAKSIDTWLITANSTNEHGILNISGANAVTYTDSTPTVPEFWPKLVDAVRQVGKNRYLPATELWMHPDRWAWLQAALDGNNRPYVSDDLAAAIPLIGQSDGTVAEGLAGTIRGLSLPVFIDPNIPVNLGSGTNEDRVVAARPSDIVLYESAPSAEAFRETKAKELQVVFRFYSYAAAVTERSPKSVSIISGTGVAAPTF